MDEAGDPHVDDLQVELAWSPGPGRLKLVALRLPPGATVEAAWLAACGLCEGLPGPRDEAAALRAGIWGKACTLDRELRDRDRVELCRGLKADPKESRRVRYQAHIARWGGKRPPRKPGQAG